MIETFISTKKYIYKNPLFQWSKACSRLRGWRITVSRWWPPSRILRKGMVTRGLRGGHRLVPHYASTSRTGSRCNFIFIQCFGTVFFYSFWEQKFFCFVFRTNFCYSVLKQFFLCSALETLVLLNILFIVVDQYFWKVNCWSIFCHIKRNSELKNKCSNWWINPRKSPNLYTIHKDSLFSLSKYKCVKCVQ